MALTKLERVPNDSPIALQTISLPIVAVSDNEEDLAVASFAPGYPFEIVAVQHFFGAAADASYDLLIDDVSALDDPAEPTEKTREDVALAESLEARRGAADSEIILSVTTEDTTGKLEDGAVYVTIRPVGLRGD